MAYTARMQNADVLVIGAGIAGASVAAELARDRSVIVVEAEARPGYHSTGRSAALYSANYGNVTIRALTRASRGFFSAPHSGFTDGPLLRPRGSLFIANAAQAAALAAFAALPDVAADTRLLDAAAARTLCPVLREDYVHGALLEADSADVDVAALHQGYLRQLRRGGGRLLTNAPVHALEMRGGVWQVRAGAETCTAAVVVNAAGAWADPVARLAGLAPLGLQPLRRSAALIDVPAHSPPDRWPMVIDVDERFYFKPDAGRLLISPADETPVAAGDAQPEDEDLAAAVERIETATTLGIERLRHRWAGLRTFAPDRTPVVGFDDRASGFFWLAGQGGYGIQTAPALARSAAALARGESLPADVADLGASAADLSPSRFAARATSKGE